MGKSTILSTKWDDITKIIIEAFPNHKLKTYLQEMGAFVACCCAGPGYALQEDIRLPYFRHPASAVVRIVLVVAVSGAAVAAVA